MHAHTYLHGKLEIDHDRQLQDLDQILTTNDVNLSLTWYSSSLALVTLHNLPSHIIISRIVVILGAM